MSGDPDKSRKAAESEIIRNVGEVPDPSGAEKATALAVSQSRSMPARLFLNIEFILS